MSATNGGVLANKDVNATMAPTEPSGKSDIKSAEHHRQILQSKMEQGQPKQYISPSDDVMSPCTAKLNALRNKQVGKVKPKSLFAQASAKKLEASGEVLFGSKPKSSSENSW